MKSSTIFLGAAGVILLLIFLTQWDSATIFRTREGMAKGVYSVSMSPMGKVTFPHVPQRAVTLDANYNDMLVSLGEGSKLAASGYRNNNSYHGFYQILGVREGYDPEKLTYLSSSGGAGFDKELFYSLHADVHHIDPVQLASMKGWNEADVEEIVRNVGPFFANHYSRDNSYQGKVPYRYYSLWELESFTAEVYRKPMRAARLKAVYDDMIRRIQAKLPPPDQRPRVGLILYNPNGRITAYNMVAGYGQAQYRDVGARDAFASIESRTYGANSSGGGPLLDVEALVAIDPDVLIVPFAIYPAAARSATSRTAYEQLLKLRNDPLAGRLRALRNGRVYPGGTPLQGPIFYLFQIEMAAKQIYPEIFGEYRDDHNYPPAEQLFDRARVVDVLNGGSGSEYGGDSGNHP